MFENLKYDILIAIGLKTDYQNNIVDQDTLDVLQFKGKSIKYCDQPEFYNPNRDFLFDPVLNVGLAKYLLGYVIGKFDETSGEYHSLMYNDSTIPKERGNCIVLRTENGSELKSQIFMNESLCYIDLIFKLMAYPADLRLVDQQLLQVR